MSAFDKYQQAGLGYRSTQEPASKFQMELTDLLNRHSMENPSGTPDHILAKYLEGCLDLFDKTVQNRAQHRGELINPPIVVESDSGGDVRND